MKDTIPLDISTDSVSLHGLKWSIEISFRYSINVVQRGCEGMVVGILWEWPFVLQWLIFLFIWASSLLIFSSPLVLPLLAIDPCSAVVLFTSCRSFCFTHGLLGILQL